MYTSPTIPVGRRQPLPATRCVNASSLNNKDELRREVAAPRNLWKREQVGLVSRLRDKLPTFRGEWPEQLLKGCLG